MQAERDEADEADDVEQRPLVAQRAAHDRQRAPQHRERGAEQHAGRRG